MLRFISGLDAHGMPAGNACKCLTPLRLHAMVPCCAAGIWAPPSLGLLDSVGFPFGMGLGFTAVPWVAVAPGGPSDKSAARLAGSSGE